MEQPSNDDQMEPLDALAGAWTLEAVFPSDPSVVLRAGRCDFEWMKGGHLLVQRMTVSRSDVPDSIAVIAFDVEKGTYTQHYFDSRGVIRLYSMSFRDGVWTLLRDSPDFSPLPFAQRFVSRVVDDGNTIRGAWEKSADGQTWELDFNLTYRRLK